MTMPARHGDSAMCVRFWRESTRGGEKICASLTWVAGREFFVLRKACTARIPPQSPVTLHYHRGHLLLMLQIPPDHLVAMQPIERKDDQYRKVRDQNNPIEPCERMYPGKGLVREGCHRLIQPLARGNERYRDESCYHGLIFIGRFWMGRFWGLVSGDKLKWRGAQYRFRISSLPS